MLPPSRRTAARTIRRSTPQIVDAAGESVRQLFVLHHRREVLDIQHTVGRQQDHARQAVPQLAHVAGPAIAHEDVHHITRDLQQRCTGDVAQQMAGKKRDVGRSLAQWGNVSPATLSR